MGDPQRILLKKEFVNHEGIFLPEEIDALVMVVERLCSTLPNARNPFSFGIGTRRFDYSDAPLPRLELALNYNWPEFDQEECLQMLHAAACPRDYLSGISNAWDYYDQSENALKDGVIVHNDGMALASVKDDGGWFVLGLRFRYSLSLECNTFAVAFLAGIAEAIYNMDEDNAHLRAAHSAFLKTCENWSITPPGDRLRKWLDESSFRYFVCQNYIHHGPRKFFG